MKYRKKPVVIEAERAADIRASMAVEKRHDLLPPWVKTALMAGVIQATVNGGLHIHTLEGLMTASPEDMVILGVKGEMYPCKPDIFDATYKQVDS